MPGRHVRPLALPSTAIETPATDVAAVAATAAAAAVAATTDAAACTPPTGQHNGVVATGLGYMERNASAIAPAPPTCTKLSAGATVFAAFALTAAALAVAAAAVFDGPDFPGWGMPRRPIGYAILLLWS